MQQDICMNISDINDNWTSVAWLQWEPIEYIITASTFGVRLAKWLQKSFLVFIVEAIQQCFECWVIEFHVHVGDVCPTLDTYISLTIFGRKYCIIRIIYTYNVSMARQNDGRQFENVFWLLVWVPSAVCLFSADRVANLHTIPISISAVYGSCRSVGCGQNLWISLLFWVFQYVPFGTK